MNKKLTNSFVAGIIVFVILIFVYYKVNIHDRSIILLERFIPGYGIIEIIFVSIYATILSYFMVDNHKKARILSWTIFSVIFFLQLVLGIFINERYLMTGHLHFPIPAVIIGGPIIRGEVGFMLILFLSTILISGPAWCSQLCYFGVWDYLSSATQKNKLEGVVWKYKGSFFLLFVLTVTLMRLFNVSTFISSISAIVFASIGIFIILFLSRKYHSMIHCTYWCPINTIVNLWSKIYPIKIKIDNNCNYCYACTFYCHYLALNKKAILNKQANINCTLCGDCLPYCHSNSIHYSLFNIKGENIRLLWIVLTVVLHAIFLTLARI